MTSILIQMKKNSIVGTTKGISMIEDGIICPYCGCTNVRSEGIRGIEHQRSRTLMFTLYVCLNCYQHFTLKSEKEE